MKKKNIIRRVLAALMSLAIIITMIPGNLMLTSQAAETMIMEIGTANELKAFRDEVNNGSNFKGYTVKLIADIVLPEKEEWIPIGITDDGTHFAGTFDGQGYTIRNLYMRSATYENNGLFGYMVGSIQNVGLIDTDISVKSDCVGSICAYMSSGGMVNNCYNTGNVTGRFSTGGIVGVNHYGTFMNCYNTGNVTGTTNVGGLCGYNEGVLQNSYNTGDVKSTQDYSGGVCGANAMIVENCYNTGAVTGPEKVGGVCGYNRYSEFYNCYYLNTSSIAAIGTFTGSDYNAGRDLYSFDTNNKLSTKVTIDEKEYESLNDTLNAWIVSKQKTYYNNWLFDADLVSYPVFKYALDKFEITFSDSVSEYIYTGESIEPSVAVSLGTTTLTKGKDYIISYAENTQAGTGVVTARGTGDYAGTLEKDFIIQAKPIDGMIATLSQTSYAYDGNAQEPAVTVTDGTNTLVNGTDYTVVYSDNTDIGTAKVIVSGQGNYIGTLEETFSITSKSINVCNITLIPDTYIYDGTEKKPAVTVTDGTKTLEKETDYTVFYSENIDVGTAIVTITGKGIYAGTKTIQFKIEQAGQVVMPTNQPEQTVAPSNPPEQTVTPTNPPKNSDAAVLKKVAITKLSSPSAKKIKITWKKDGKASGYEVQLAKNKKFTDGKKSAVSKKNGTVTKTFTGLKKGKTYYVRVRAYKIIAGKKQHGTWSAVKNKKCK